MNKQDLIQTIPTVICDLIRASRAGETVGDIVNRTLEMLCLNNVFDTVTYFSMDTVTFNFQSRYIYPRTNLLEVKNDLYQTLVENGTIAEVLQNIKPVSWKSETALVIIIPVIASTVIEGLILAEVSRDLSYNHNEHSDILLVLGSSLGAQIEVVNLSVELKTSQRFVEQKVAAQTLFLNQMRLKLKTIIDNVLIGIMLVDANTNTIAEANTAALSLIGSSAEEVLHKNVDRYLHLLENDTNESLATMTIREAALTKSDGVIVPLMRTTAIVNLDGKEFLIESFIDISERKEFEEKLQRVNLSLDEQVKKRTQELEEIVSRLESEISERNKFEQALYDSENMLSLIFDTAGIGLCLSEDSSLIIRINKEFNNVFDLEYEDHRYNNLVEILADHVVEFKNGTTHITSELLYDSLNGKTFEIQTNKNHKYIFINSARLSREDNTQYYVTAITDITAQKEAESDIRKALEKEKELHDLKTNFISMISHEFRTPLTTILSYTQLLKKYRQQWTHEQQEIYLDNIEIGVKRMTNLLNDALLIGQGQSGFLIYNPRECDVKKMIEDVIRDLVVSFDFKREILYSIDIQQTTLILDDKLLRQVLHNLVSNALKYSNQDTSVEVNVVADDSNLYLTVTDKGIGIPEKYLSDGKIFEAFVRADNVGNVSGTGLGMAIIKNAIELQNGTIQVESVQNLGTTIKVSVPLQMRI